MPADLNLLEFLGAEHTNFLISFNAFRQEFSAFSHIDTLYQVGVRTAEVPPSSMVTMQLLIFCHYHLYFSTTTLMRCHLSDAFASLRVAIEASLHAYRIIAGDGTVEQYVNRDKTFLYSVNRIRKAREKDPEFLPLAGHLLKIHEACSQYGSHADFDAFTHRLQMVRARVPMMQVHYFQKPERTADFQFYMVTLLHTFVVILNVFEGFLKNEMKTVDDAWSGELREIGETLERWRRQLNTSYKAPAKEADAKNVAVGSERDDLA